MIQLKLLKPFGLLMIFFTICSAFSFARIVKIEKSTDSNIVLLISTPNMKPSSNVQGDYDRVKLALAKEFGNDVKNFVTQKNAFVLMTNTTDVEKVESVKRRIISVIADAKIEVITFDELKKLRL